MSSRRWVVRRALILLGLLGVVGCAHQAVTVQQPPLASEVRAQLGTIGVLWTGDDPTLRYDMPVKGAWAGAGRAVSGAMKGWFAPFASRNCCGGGAGEGYLLLTYALLGITVVPVVSASAGAILAPSAVAVEEATVALERAQAELWTAVQIQERVLATAQSQTPYTFVGLQRFTPPVPDTPLPENPYQSLAAGVTTVLELSGPTFALAMETTGTHINPDLHLSLRLRSRLLRTADASALYDYEAEYRSPDARTLVAWGADGAQAFRVEVEAGTREILAKLLDRLFLAEVPAPPPAESPVQPVESPAGFVPPCYQDEDTCG